MLKDTEDLNCKAQAHDMAMRESCITAKTLHGLTIELFVDRFLSTKPSLSILDEANFLEENPCTLSNGKTLDSQSIVAIRILDQVLKTGAFI